MVKHKKGEHLQLKMTRVQPAALTKFLLPSQLSMLFSGEADSLTVNRIQVTRGAFFRRLKRFTPCLSAIKPVAACCQFYQRDWQRPQKGTARLR